MERERKGRSKKMKERPGPTSNKYSLLSSDLCVSPLSDTFSTTTERKTGCFKANPTGGALKAFRTNQS